MARRPYRMRPQLPVARARTFSTLQRAIAAASEDARDWGGRYVIEWRSFAGPYLPVAYVEIVDGVVASRIDWDHQQVPA